MRVGLSAYLLHQGPDYRAAGVSRYVHELLVHLPAARPEHNYLAFHGSDAPSLAGVESVLAPLPTERAPLRILWEQLGLPIQALKSKVDLLHATVNVLPLLGTWPCVLTVHDLAFLRHPDRFPSSKAKYLRFAVSLSCQKAKRVIAVSEHTKEDLLELFRLPPEKISVVYSGVGESFRPVPHHETEMFRRSVFGGRPYLLHVGTLEPRKNLDVLIRSFAEMRRERHIPHVLALVGAKGWMFGNLQKIVIDLGLKEHVRFVDYVAPAELPLWYNCADLFAYPSQYEGFGLPVLEAMACGSPVVTSASSGTGELAGDACLTVEPGSQQALEVAMNRVLEDAGLRESMRMRGLARAEQFSWYKTASQTVDVYEEAKQETAG